MCLLPNKWKISLIFDISGKEFSKDCISSILCGSFALSSPNPAMLSISCPLPPLRQCSLQRAWSGKWLTYNDRKLILECQTYWIQYLQVEFQGKKVPLSGNESCWGFGEIGWRLSQPTGSFAICSLYCKSRSRLHRISSLPHPYVLFLPFFSLAEQALAGETRGKNNPSWMFCCVVVFHSWLYNQKYCGRHQVNAS